MKSKLIKINIFIFILLLLFLEFFLLVSNYIFGGVPIYRQLNISEDEVISYKKSKYLKGEIQILDDFYIKTFNGVNKKDYLKKYINENSLNHEKIFYVKGANFSFPYFADKNLCRENKDSNYNYSDTVLIGDSSLFGDTIASPYDIVGRLRQLNPNKIFLNLGIPGTDPRQQVNHLKEVTKETQFENLVWIFVEANDYELNTGRFPKCGYKDYNDEKNVPESLETKYSIDQSSLLSLRIFLAEHLRGLASFSKLFISYDKKFNLNKKIYEEKVKELNTYLEKKKVKNKILYYLPYYNRHAYKTNFLIHPNVKKLNILKEDVKDITSKYGFKFIDGDEAVVNVKKKIDLYHYGYPTHYNAKGYTLTAEHLSSYLAKR